MQVFEDLCVCETDRKRNHTCISLRSLSHKPCKGSIKFCLTSMSKESFTSANLFILSPTSIRAPPAHKPTFLNAYTL